ncbi:MFS transporter [Neobacillus muris]|uniref:MFS transporter n=1 Tax=Neobacillus muris TaxID=2941334 RepID=UPI00203C6563|nr:MFS transporter [Neobacillus muris]
MKETLIIRSREDVINFVNDNPVKKGSLLVILVALGGIFVDAYDVVSIGIGASQLREEFHLSPEGLGLLTSILAVGALLGGLIGGYYTDRFGRKKMFTLDLLLLVISALGAALAPNFTLLVIFRFLMGVGIGLDMPVALSFIAEYSNTKKKGSYVNLWQPMWYVATVGTGLVVLPVFLLGVDENLWRWAVGFGAAFALIVLIMRLVYMNESPLWAAKNLPLKDAAAILEKTYKVPVVVEHTGTNMNEGPEKNIPYTAIFTEKYKMRTILAAIISGTQSIQYFAVGFYIPTISLILFGEGMINSITGTIVFNICGIIGGFTGVFLTQKLGMRRIAIIGYVIVALSLLVIGIANDETSFIWSSVPLGLFIFGHSFGPGAQGKTMATLSYPTELRGLGTGFAEGSSRVGSIIGFFLFPVSLASFGLAKTFLFFSIVPIIGLISAFIIKWDPTGMDIEKEQNDMNITHTSKEIERPI